MHDFINQGLVGKRTVRGGGGAGMLLTHAPGVCFASNETTGYLSRTRWVMVG